MSTIDKIAAYRRTHGVSLAEARRIVCAEEEREEEAASRTLPKHTPGPWVVAVERRRQGAYDTIYGPERDGGSREVALTDCDADGCTGRNALLVAASPELADVLSTLVYWHDHDGRIDESWWEAARDVLRKAGRS